MVEFRERAENASFFDDEGQTSINHQGNQKGAKGLAVAHRLVLCKISF